MTSIEPIHYSALRRMDESPAHFLHAATAPWESGTLAQRMGSAAHAATFEPHRIALYDGIRRGKAFDKFKAEAGPDAVVVNARELSICTSAANALRRHDIAGPLLFGPGVVVEQHIEWSRRGRRCSSRPDARLPGRHIVDLKTARTAQPERFMSSARWSRYHAQLAFYQEADAADLGIIDPCAALYIVAIELRPPFVVTVFQLTALAIEHGRAAINQWWERMEVCAASNSWPGYSLSVVPFDTGDPDDDFDMGANLDAGHDVSDNGDAIDWDAA